MTDTNLQAEMDAFDAIGDSNGIKYTTWSFHDIKASQMNDPHPFGKVKRVANSSCGTYCCSSFEVKLQGNRWIDVWIAFDRLREMEGWTDMNGKTHGCDHRFIEGFERTGTILFVSTGS